jgi:hypothetical protein
VTVTTAHTMPPMMAATMPAANATIRFCFGAGATYAGCVSGMGDEDSICIFYPLTGKVRSKKEELESKKVEGKIKVSTCVRLDGQVRSMPMAAPSFLDPYSAPSVFTIEMLNVER